MDQKKMLMYAGAAAVFYYLYKAGKIPFLSAGAGPVMVMPPPPKPAAEAGGEMDTMSPVRVAQAQQGVPATAASTGDIKNAAAPTSAAEKYYGVGGVEFKAQGLSRASMKSGPSFGPSCRK